MAAFNIKLLYVLLVAVCNISNISTSEINESTTQKNSAENLLNIQNINLDKSITEDQLGNTTEITGHLHSQSYNENIMGDVSLELRGAVWKFSVEFEADVCCPILHLYSDRTSIQEEECYDDQYVHVDLIYNNMMVHLNPSLTSFLNCDESKVVNSSKNMTTILIRCYGERYFLYQKYSLWNVSFGYICSQVKPLNLMYNISLTELFEGKPRPLTHETCLKYVDYKHYIVPNLIGMINHNEINMLAHILITGGNIEFMHSCYQHSTEGICRFFFPNTVNGRIHYPCQQMCLDFVIGCAALLEALGYDMTCSWLLHSNNADECLDKPVTCDPPNITNAFPVTNNISIVMSEAAVECIDGYELAELNQDGTIQCAYSGAWKPQLTCQEQVIIPYIILLVIGAVFLLILIVSGISKFVCVQKTSNG